MLRALSMAPCHLYRHERKKLYTDFILVHIYPTIIFKLDENL
jgi:hypothetical protein